jgi:hypothetical protein
MRRQKLEEKLWDGIDTSGGDLACWEWQGPKYPSGYGYLDGKSVHRLIYEILVEPIPDGMMVCHKCDNPPCCNPAHLFLGTAQDNCDDMIRKGRQGWASTPKPPSGLTEDQCRMVVDMFMDGMKPRAIERATGWPLRDIKSTLSACGLTA